MNVGRSNSVADIINRTADGGSATLPSCKLRQQQTVRNLSVRLLRPDKKRQTPKLPVECETQHILTHTHTHIHTRTKATYGGRGQAALCEREVVRLPSPQEFGGEDLAEEGAGVFDHAHLDVPLVEQLVSHPAAAAVVQGSLARPRSELGVIITFRHLPQQRLVLLTLIKLVVVQLVAPAAAAAAAAVEIHG